MIVSTRRGALQTVAPNTIETMNGHHRIHWRTSRPMAGEFGDRQEIGLAQPELRGDPALDGRGAAGRAATGEEVHQAFSAPSRIHSTRPDSSPTKSQPSGVTASAVTGEPLDPLITRSSASAASRPASTAPS